MFLIASFVHSLELQAALNAARDRSVELSTSLEDEKNRSTFLEVSLENEKEKKDESAKTEKLVAQQLKGALDVVQVMRDFLLRFTADRKVLKCSFKVGDATYRTFHRIG